MSECSCPFYTALRKKKDDPFFSGEKSLTYEELGSYILQLEEDLPSHPKGSLIAYIPEDPLFFTALLFHCLRHALLLLPLHQKLPLQEVKELCKRHSVTSFLQTIVPFDGKKRKYPPTRYPLDQPLTCLLTSGSTSFPKLCVHSFGNHYYSALGSNRYLPYGPEDGWLLSLPLYHVSGLSLLFRTILAKASLILPSSLENSLKNPSLTHISLVPTQLQRMIENPLLRKLKVILLGGAPAPERLLRQAEEKHLNLFQTYSLTEMSSQVVTTHPVTGKLAPLPYRKYKISPQGEILVKGKTLFLGYLENGKIAPDTDTDGWFATKDLGIRKKNGLHIQGRSDNLFISGGENVQPEEIERLLLEIEGLEQAVVIPIPDEEFGQRPVAFVRTSLSFQPEVWNKILSEKVPKYKLPLSYHPLQENLLKPSRRELKKLYSETVSSRDDGYVASIS